MSNVSLKKTSAVIAIAVIGVVAILVISGVNSENSEIQIENENFSLYSNQTYAHQIINQCKEDVHCSINSLQTLTKLENESTVLGIFSDLVTEYESKYPCHEIGHHLGMWLNAYVGDEQDALILAQQQCGGSIFHGVIQNHLQIQKFKNISISEINIHELCSKFIEDSSFIYRWQCLHGLGHGLADIYDYDVQSAVIRCDEFESNLEQISCSKGMFMQNAVHWAETNTGDFDDNDLFYPCNAVPIKYAPPCYHYHISYMALKTGGINVQVDDAFDLCDKISPEEMIRFCYYGMGREMESLTTDDWEKALKLCQEGDKEELYPFCIEGMLMTMVNGNSDPARGFSFCKSLPMEYKSTCYTGLGKWILLLSPDYNHQENLCSMAENKNYYDVCINAKTDSLKLL